MSGAMQILLELKGNIDPDNLQRAKVHLGVDDAQACAYAMPDN